MKILLMPKNFITNREVIEMFKIKFSDNMAKQLPEPENEFKSTNQAYMFGIRKYGSGTMDSPMGWTVEEIKSEA